MKIEYTLKTGTKLVMGERRGQMEYARGPAYEYIKENYEGYVIQRQVFSQ